MFNCKNVKTIGWKQNVLQGQTSSDALLQCTNTIRIEIFLKNYSETIIRICCNKYISIYLIYCYIFIYSVHTYK